MKLIVCLGVFLFLLACTRNNSADTIYEPDKYFRVTSNDDSIKNMYVIYKSQIDPKLFMYKFYWDNGKVQGISYFINNVKVGPWIRYFDDGRIAFKGNYENGKRTGSHKIYYQDGKLSSNETFINDIKKGECIYYNPDGTVLRIENYK